ncbi:MAG: hypothetical protein WC756_06740 [Taibaiella sp.]
MERFTPERLGELYMYLYQHEYGNKKLVEIAQKVSSNVKVDQYIQRLFLQQRLAGTYDFLLLMNEVPYFIFSKAETVCCGALMAFDRWCSYAEQYTEKSALQNIIISIIFKADSQKLHFKQTFFDKFYKLIDDVCNNRVDANVLVDF